MTTQPEDSRQGTAPLWDDDDMLARYKQAFEANPDVHLWAFMCWMRDELNADRQRLAAKIVALEMRLVESRIGELEGKVADLTTRLRIANAANMALVDELEGGDDE